MSVGRLYTRNYDNYIIQLICHGFPLRATYMASVAHDEDTKASMPDLPPSRKIQKTLRMLEHAEDVVLPKPSQLSRMPFELLAEILTYTTSPKDILAVARCSKYFCDTLVRNEASYFIWRRLRAQCIPEPIPDPTPNFTEPSYAAFLFDGGECEVDWTQIP
jgi:hypothetical protein